MRSFIRIYQNFIRIYQNFDFNYLFIFVYLFKYLLPQTQMAQTPTYRERVIVLYKTKLINRYTNPNENKL